MPDTVVLPIERFVRVPLHVQHSTLVVGLTSFWVVQTVRSRNRRRQAHEDLMRGWIAGQNLEWMRQAEHRADANPACVRYAIDCDVAHPLWLLGKSLQCDPSLVEHVRAMLATEYVAKVRTYLNRPNTDVPIIEFAEEKLFLDGYSKLREVRGEKELGEDGVKRATATRRRILYAWSRMALMRLTQSWSCVWRLAGIIGLESTLLTWRWKAYENIATLLKQLVLSPPDSLREVGTTLLLVLSNSCADYASRGAERYLTNRMLRHEYITTVEKVGLLDLEFFDRYTPAQVLKFVSSTSLMNVPSTLSSLCSLIRLLRRFPKEVTRVQNRDTIGMSLALILSVLPPVFCQWIDQPQPLLSVPGGVHFTSSIDNFRVVRLFGREREMLRSLASEPEGKGYNEIFHDWVRTISRGGLLYYAGRQVDGWVTQDERQALLQRTSSAYYGLAHFATSLRTTMQTLWCSLADLAFVYCLNQPVVGRIEGRKGRITPTLRGHLTFHNVSFQYPTGKSQVALSSLSVDIPAGSMLGVVGNAGSGKSTLLSLIERLYEPTSGEIELDGLPLRDYDVKWLRKQMAVVMQTPLIFSLTVLDNIRFGHQEATLDEVVDVAKRVGAYEFILRLPEGFQTRIGDGFIRLSGGQQQLVAIARALLRDPPLVILDEPMNSLDSHQRNTVQHALKTLTVGRTCIYVTHCLTELLNAHNILVMREGRCLQQGSYDELKDASIIV